MTPPPTFSMKVPKDTLKRVQERGENAKRTMTTNATRRKAKERTERNIRWLKIPSPTVKSACSLTKHGLEILRASILTNARIGTKSASAALVGSFRNVFSPTAHTWRVTCQPRKFLPPFFRRCRRGSNHAAADGSGRSLATSDLLKRHHEYLQDRHLERPIHHLPSFLTGSPIKSIIEHHLGTP
jgi:hypothetical protein